MHFDDCHEIHPLPGPDWKPGVSFNNSENIAEFSIWAPGADDVHLVMFREDISDISGRHDVQLLSQAMEYDPGSGLWSTKLTAEKCLDLFYEYHIVRDGRLRKSLDPYARAVGLNRVSNREFLPKLRGLVLDSSVFADPVPLAEGTVFPCDAVIYELHIRDFTINHKGIAKPGTFAACIERIPYLKSLGITHVQIMPVLKTAFLDESRQSFDNASTGECNYNWGYDPHSFFALNNWYSENPEDPCLVILELRNLVRELHAAGLRVILDVVYNHMADASILEDIVPGYYFRRDYGGAFRSDSQCGNDLASARYMVRKLVCDSVTYLTKTFGIDGFRFDLMGLLDADTVLSAKAAAEKASGRSDLFFYGEGWRMYSGPHNLRMMDQDYMQFTDEVAVFNDELRDLLKSGGAREVGRGFATEAEVDIAALVQNMLGNPVKYFQVMSPRNLVQYAAAHDGMTLHDSIAYNCQLDDSRSTDIREIDRRICLVNFLLLCSQGIVMLHSGQEFGRSKSNSDRTDEPDSDWAIIGKYIANSYNSSDLINGLPAELDSRQEKLLNYCSSLIHARRNLSVLRLASSRVIEKRSCQLQSQHKMFLAFALRENASIYLVCANAGSDEVQLDIPEELLGCSMKGISVSVIVDRDFVNLAGIAVPAGITVKKRKLILQGLSWALLLLVDETD
ncbi:hypothetical protein JCM12856_12900 [Spirochaeta dissipatitropha]